MNSRKTLPRADFLTQILEDLYASTAALGQMSGKVHGVGFCAGIGIAQVLMLSVLQSQALTSFQFFPVGLRSFAESSLSTLRLGNSGYYEWHR